MARKSWFEDARGKSTVTNSNSSYTIYSSFLLSTSERYIDQKKNTQFKYSTRKSGGTKPMLMTVAGIQSFPVWVGVREASFCP